MNYYLWNPSTSQSLNVNSIFLPANQAYADVLLVPVDSSLHATALSVTLTLQAAQISWGNPNFHSVPRESATVNLPTNAPVIDIAAVAPSIQEGGGAQNAFKVTITNGNLAPTPDDTITLLNQFLSIKIQDVYGATLPWPSNIIQTCTYDIDTASYSVALEPQDDGQATGDRTITLSITPSGNGMVYQVAHPSAQVTVKDHAPIISLIVAWDHADSTYPGKFTLIKQGILASVSFDILPGTNAAVRGVDYELCDATGQMLTGNNAIFPADHCRASGRNGDAIHCAASWRDDGISKPRHGNLSSIGNFAAMAAGKLLRRRPTRVSMNFDFLNRQTRRCGMLLISNELASLVHLPSASVRSTKLVRAYKKTKAAPVIARNRGVFLGTNTHNGEAFNVSQNAEQRVRHTFVIGASGTGKSTSS